MDYMTCRQAAEKWGLGERIVRRWCQQGRIPKAKKNGRSYLLPSESLPPSDRRCSAAARTEQLLLAMLMDPDFPGKTDFEHRFMQYTDLCYQGCLQQAEELLSRLLEEARTDSLRLPVLIQLSSLKTLLGKPEEYAEILQKAFAIISSGDHPAYDYLLDVFYDKTPVLPEKDIEKELLPFLLLRSTRNLIMNSISQPQMINLHHLEILGSIIDNTAGELIQVYFHALLAVAALLTSNELLQRSHEEKAREIILRRKWYLLFAEYYYFLDWQIDRYVTDEAELSFIQNLTQELFESYIRCAEAEKDFTRPELMTPALLKTAVLRGLNKSNAEISRYMNTSSYHIRKYLEELSICTDNADDRRMKEIIHSVMWFM